MIGTWIQATRPRTLLAGLVPVAVGTALASRMVTVSWAHAVGCAVGALLIQVGVNFANDAFDALAGADTPDRLGPRRAVASGLISARAMFVATALVLLAAFAVGCWLALAGGWPILVLGVVSLVCAIAYTGGPWPLAYHGLGDLFVFLFFGLFAVLGSAWVQVAAVAPRLPLPWWLVASAVGLQATAIIAVNNLRDIPTDARVGKNTLAVRLGARCTRLYYAGLHLAATALLAAVAAREPHRAWLLPALAAGALGALLARGVARCDGAGLNPFLGRSAAVELVTGACIVGACIASA